MNSRWYTRSRRWRQNIQRWILATAMTCQWDDDDGGGGVDDEVKDEETKHFQKMVFANGLYIIEANCLHTVRFPRNANVNAYGATHTHTHNVLGAAQHHNWDLGSPSSFGVFMRTPFPSMRIFREDIYYFIILEKCFCVLEPSRVSTIASHPVCIAFAYMIPLSK